MSAELDSRLSLIGIVLETLRARTSRLGDFGFLEALGFRGSGF